MVETIVLNKISECCINFGVICLSELEGSILLVLCGMLIAFLWIKLVEAS